MRSISLVFFNFFWVIVELCYYCGFVVGVSEEEEEGFDSDEEVYCCVFVFDDEFVFVICLILRFCGFFSFVIGVGYLRVFDINLSFCMKEVIIFYL